MIVHNNSLKKTKPHTVRQHQILVLIAAMQNNDWEASYQPSIWPHQQSTAATNVLQEVGSSKHFRGNLIQQRMQQFVYVTA